MSGSALAAYRVFRGGCWFYDSQYAWVAIRSSGAPVGRSDVFGLRLVRRLP